MRFPAVATCALMCAVLWSAAAAGEARAQGDLRSVLKDADIAPHWIYDDLPKAKALAKETGKPLLVVIRCVPCPPGKTLDRAVSLPDAEMKALQDQFVCVRVVQTNGLDLSVFQYDYDNSWAAMFFGPDGTIYGRYGTRNASGPGSDGFHNAESFRKTLQRTLDLHKNIAAEKAGLAAKVGKPPVWAMPEKIPGLGDKAGKANTRQNCIHCHMVREYDLRAKWSEGKLTLADLQPYPMPDRIGIKLDETDGLKVKSVAADKPSAKAGIREGDELVRLDGQPLLSMADVQWVLHNAPAETTLKAVVRRAGAEVAVDVPLTGDWKASDISWRASSWYGLRQGLRAQVVPEADRAKRGLPSDKMALAVTGIFGKGGQVLTKAGLKKDDIIVAMDGKTDPLTDSEFLIRLRLDHGPKDSVRFTVMRGGKPVELTIPMW